MRRGFERACMYAGLWRTPVRGFSYLELVVVIALIGTLIAVAAVRLVPYVAQAERVAVARLEGELRSALMLEAARLIARGESARLGELEASNPMALVFEPPTSYLGELSAPDPRELPVRHWYFDTATRRLGYRAGSGFRGPGGAGTATLEYAVHVVFEDEDGDGRFVPGADRLHGVRLQRVSGAGAVIGDRVASDW